MTTAAERAKEADDYGILEEASHEPFVKIDLDALAVFFERAIQAERNRAVAYFQAYAEARLTRDTLDRGLPCVQVKMLAEIDAQEFARALQSAPSDKEKAE